MMVFMSSQLGAQETKFDFDKPWYLGLGISNSEVGFQSGSRTSGDTIVSFSGDNSAVSFWLLAGMQYHEHYDIELRYHQLGGFDHSIKYVDASKQIQVNVDSDLDYQSFDALIKPKLSWGGFQVNASAGLSLVLVERVPGVSIVGGQDELVREEFLNAISPNINVQNDRGLVLKYGLGMEYKSKKAYAWRYDIYWSEFDDEDIASQALSFSWYFAEDSKR